MAKSTGGLFWGALALALLANGHSGAGGRGGAMPVSMALASQIGQPVTMERVRVASVPADEGFWLDSDHGRVWVQIDTNCESPYTVRAGDVISLRGQVVANGPNFPALVGVSRSGGAADLAAAGAHITVPVQGIRFGP